MLVKEFFNNIEYPLQKCESLINQIVSNGDLSIFERVYILDQ